MQLLFLSEKNRARIRRIGGFLIRRVQTAQSDYFPKNEVLMKTAVFLAPGFEEIEACTVIDYLRRAEIQVDVVAVPESNAAECAQAVTGAHGITLIADTTLSQLVKNGGENELDAMYLPGGLKGAENLAANMKIAELIAEMNKKSKIVAAICASPAIVLAKTGILAGKKWTCYPEMEKNLAEYCGSTEKAEEFTANATHIPDVPFVLAGNVLTGRGPGTTEQFAMKLVALLTDEKTAAAIHDGSCQR